jgi:hypothetical protein
MVSPAPATTLPLTEMVNQDLSDMDQSPTLELMSCKELVLDNRNQVLLFGNCS